MAADETVYSAEPLLKSPRRFAAAARADLRVVPPGAWRVWVRGLQARHRQSRLGYLWLLAPSLAIALTWVYLDSAEIVDFGDVGIPYLAYVLSGVLLWQVFTDALLAPLRQLTAARQMLSKGRLPHETWMVAGALDVLFNAAIRLVVLAIVLAATTTWGGASVLLVPLGLATLVVLGLALGLALTPVGLLYEDVAHGITLVTGFWFFLTPIVYAWPTDLPGATLVEVNPVTPALVTTRAWLTGAPGAEAGQTALVALAGVALLVASWLVYRLARPHLVARL